MIYDTWSEPLSTKILPQYNVDQLSTKLCIQYYAMGLHNTNLFSSSIL